MACDTLDRVRATGATPQTQTVLMADLGGGVNDNPMIADWIPAQTQQNHWIVEQVAFVGTCVVRAPALQPVSGLYLCPQSTPIESLADAQNGWNQNARPFPIPTDIAVANITVAGSPEFAIIMTARAGFKFTLPPGWFVRAIVVSAPGLAAPGPGLGSNGSLNLLATLEKPCSAS
jgi:hypothetical protein